jgi:hypothetical protein
MLDRKMVRCCPHLAKPTIELLLPQVMSQYCNVTLAMGVMHVNGIPMLVIISRNICFATVEALPNHNIPMLEKGIKSVATMYKRAGFYVTTTLMLDGEFEAMCGDLADLEIGALSKMARDEHVGNIKRFIHMLKERMQAIYNSLPFINMPLQIVIEMAKHAVYYWLNAFLYYLNGMSDNLSP